jgi:outer membrane protein
MKGINVYFFMTFTLACSLASAQEQPYMLTLVQAREYAVQHNKSLLNARDQVTSSKKKVMETVAQGLPQVAGSLDYMTYFNYKMYLDFGSSGGSGGFEQLFTDPDIDAGDQKILTALGQMFGTSEPIIMSDQLSGKIQFSQLIFSGQYIAGIQTAKIARKLADQSLVKSELDVKENVTNSYFVILTTEQTLQILSRNLENLAAIIQHSDNLYKAGVLEETDVLELKITVNELKNTQKTLERMNQLNYNMLKFQLGIAPETNVVLADSLDLFIRCINPQAALSDSFDINTNITYQLMESQVALTRKQVDIQNWAYAPTVAGFYSYTEKFITTGFDLTPNHLAGISVSVPIFSSGMRNSQVAQAKINLDIARRDREMIKDQLETQNRQLAFNYENALENYYTQKENVSVAGQVYTNKQNKYKQGLLSSSDLSLANSDYLKAEGNYITAVMTLLQAQTSLDKLYNRL